MKYKIIGDNLQMLRVELAAGEGLFAEAGSMVNMSGHIQMESQMAGGIFAGTKRILIGESFFLTKFVPIEKHGFVAFAGNVPGKIFPVHLSNGSEFVGRRESFLCCEEGIVLDITFAKKVQSGPFGGAGFILQNMSGNGTVFLHCCGDIVEINLKDNEMIKVQTGLVVGFDSTVSYDIALAGGITSIIFGGEGLFVTTLTGPGKVILQSMDIAKIAASIIPYLPKPKEITGKK